MEEIEIALFPIPGQVSLPTATVPLHVFEPRYRKLIQDSVSANRRIAVAHTRREVLPSRLPNYPAPEDYLKHNLATFEFHPVFSAGFAEIEDTLPDGRILVNITMDGRYQALEEIQKIPYPILRCRSFLDQPSSSERANLLRTKLDQTLLNLDVPNAVPLHEHLNSEAWKNLSLSEYSFKIYSLILFEPDVMQEVLEMRSSEERVEFLLDALTQTPFAN